MKKKPKGILHDIKDYTSNANLPVYNCRYI